MDSVELNGSHVARSWTVFIDETEKMVKYIKENAEFLANNTIDKINALYAVSRVNGNIKHRCTWFENPGSMRFLPKLWREGMWEL
jgi:hypothetical protein